MLVWTSRKWLYKRRKNSRRSWPRSAAGFLCCFEVLNTVISWKSKITYTLSMFNGTFFSRSDNVVFWWTVWTLDFLPYSYNASDVEYIALTNMVDNVDISHTPMPRNAFDSAIVLAPWKSISTYYCCARVCLNTGFDPPQTLFFHRDREDAVSGFMKRNKNEAPM